ncbi:MAG: exodeoxyribonuclease VII small subunit [Alphaproteobacteria bacterium]
MTDEIKIPTDVAAMSFEDAMAELEDIVDRLEAGNVALDDSIALYGRGAALKSHCEAKLKTAEARIEKVVRGADGAATGAESFDGEG